MSNFEGILTFFYCLAGEADKAWFEQIPRLRFAALGMTVALRGRCRTGLQSVLVRQRIWVRRRAKDCWAT